MLFEEIFFYFCLNEEKLAPYGFVQDGGNWRYDTTIMEGEFALSVTVDKNGNADTSLVEVETEYEYCLYKTSASGTYVGSVRAAIADELAKIVAYCYEPSAYKSRQAVMLIAHAREMYGTELEFLWEKFPSYAVWRRNDNAKWYGVIGTVQRSKLGFDTDELAEIVDMQIEQENMGALMEQEHYYPGWYMSKKTWYTIVLDDTVPDCELKRRFDESYRIAGTK